MNDQPFTAHFKMRIFRCESILFTFELHNVRLAIKHLFKTLSNTPDLYLDELRLELQERLGVSVSISTIWRTLRKGGYTMRKVCYQYSGKWLANSEINSFLVSPLSEVLRNEHILQLA